MSEGPAAAREGVDQIDVWRVLHARSDIREWLLQGKVRD